MQFDPIQVTVTVTTVLERLGVSYLIGGSLASTLHGMIRTTQDSHILADLKKEHVRPFIQELQVDFYIDDEMVANAVTLRSSFNIIHRESMFKIDVFMPRQRRFEKMQFARARRETLSVEPELKAKVSTPEDILLAKLDWYRMGGEVSERQWRDVMGVLKVQAGALDLEYLHTMAKELQIDDLLDRALSEIIMFSCLQLAKMTDSATNDAPKGRYNFPTEQPQNPIPEVKMSTRLDWIQEEINGLKEAGLYNHIRTMSSPREPGSSSTGKRRSTSVQTIILDWPTTPACAKPPRMPSINTASARAQCAPSPAP